MREDYNFVIKITTNCPAHCKCCVNRRKHLKIKMRIIQFLIFHILKNCAQLLIK